MPSYKDNEHIIADKYKEYQERMAAGDKSAAILNARQLVELMVNSFMDAAALQLPQEQDTAAERIDTIFRAGVISYKTRDNYHFIRKTANYVIHNREVPNERIEQSFELLEIEYQKFQTKYDLDKIASEKRPQQERTIPKATNRYRTTNQRTAVFILGIILVLFFIFAMGIVLRSCAVSRSIAAEKNPTEQNPAEQETDSTWEYQEEFEESLSEWKEAYENHKALHENGQSDIQREYGASNESEDDSTEEIPAEDAAEPSDLEPWMQEALDTWDELPSDEHRSLRTTILSIGETDTPQAARVWNIEKAKSMDESVVTVDNTGKVTAVGKGQAKVLICSSVGAVSCYLYIVN